MSRLPPRVASRFLEQLAEFLAAGLPLPEAVASMGPGQRSAAVRKLVADLERALAARQGLEPALPILRDTFGPGTGELLLWAEEQGRLEKSLRLLSHVERRRTAYSKSWKIALGPLIAIQLLMAIVPNPMIGLARGFLAVCAVVGVATLLLYVVRTPLLSRARDLVDRALWEVPFIRDPVRTANLVRYFWALALSADSGISLQLCLANARDSLPNTFGAARARLVERDLEGGAHLTEALAAHLPLQPAERAVLHQGETSGNLPESLTWVAETRMAEIARTADRVSMTVVAAPYALFLLQWLIVLVMLVM